MRRSAFRIAISALGAHEQNKNATTSKPIMKLNLFFIVSQLMNLRSNIIIFLKNDTFLQKKSFFCRHENEDPTPININSAPPLPTRLREVSRKPLQAATALPYHDQPFREPIL